MVNKSISTNKQPTKSGLSELAKFSLSFEYDKTYSEVKRSIHSRKDLSLS